MLIENTVRLDTPASVTGKLEKIQRNVLWDSSSGERKFHLVNREISRHQSVRVGLGLKI